jgi:hypothetical protein
MKQGCMIVANGNPPSAKRGNSKRWMLLPSFCSRWVWQILR